MVPARDGFSLFASKVPSHLVEALSRAGNPWALRSKPLAFHPVAGNREIGGRGGPGVMGPKVGKNSTMLPLAGGRQPSGCGFLNLRKPI